jgi:hypothetical protein
MMQFTTPTGRYHVTSHGNGWAYEVHCQATGDSLWFQDDDATQFQTDTEDLTNEDAIRTYFDCLCE